MPLSEKSRCDAPEQTGLWRQIQEANRPIHDHPNAVVSSCTSCGWSPASCNSYRIYICRQSRIFRQSTDFPHQPCPGRRSQLSFWKPIDKKEVSARSFLVPDITPNAGQTAETVRRALEAADSMALWEVGVRTIIEIAIFLFIGRIIISFAGKLARRADEVCLFI